MIALAARQRLAINFHCQSSRLLARVFRAVRPDQSAMSFRSLPILSSVERAAGKALARLNRRVSEGVVTAPVRRLLPSR
jgi:hypothetical protein